MVDSPRVVPDRLRRAWLFGAACMPALARGAAGASTGPRVPILAFHRFAGTVEDSMTVRIARFEAQLRVLEDLACDVIPLAAWVAWRLARARGQASSLPARAVVLTADDGHRSQLEQMTPRLRERGWLTILRCRCSRTPTGIPTC